MNNRCEECGSWDSECGSPKPILDCGCNRCLSHTNGLLREEIEYLKDVLRQVAVDINDPHPRTGTLEGFRKCMFSTEKMIVRVLNGEKVDVM